MIVDFLLNILYVFILFVTSFFTVFSDVPANNDLTASIVTLSSYFSSLDRFVPLATIFAIVTFELAFELAWFIYKLIRWSYSKVPGIT